MAKINEKHKNKSEKEKKVVASIQQESILIPEAAREKKSKKKLSFEIWFSIINLVLTTAIGIWLALYINHAQQESEWANIVITNNPFGGSHGGNRIVISNEGPSTAKELTVSICVDSINPIWIEQISDISKFSIRVNRTNPSLTMKEEYQNTTCDLALSANAKNTFLLKVDFLPPDESVELIISVPPTVSTRPTTVNVKVLMLISSNEENSWRESWDVAIMPAIIKKFMVASIHTNASCTNCRVNEVERIDVFPPSPNGINLGFNYSPTVLKDTPEYFGRITNATIIRDLPEGITVNNLILYLVWQNEPMQFVEMDSTAFNFIMDMPACHDYIDNDDDGFIDTSDPNCSNKDDFDERQ